MSDDNTQDGAEPSPASAGYGGISLLRRACRKMGRELFSTDRFVTTAIGWLQEAHGNIRVEFRDQNWHVEPLDEEGEWAGKDAGCGLDLASALAWAIINKEKP
jgi:hypothetical protein